MSESNGEEVIESIQKAQLYIQIGKTIRHPRTYFLPAAPGILLITKSRIVFSSKYSLKSGIKILHFIPIFKRDQGKEGIHVEIPIRNIIEFYKGSKQILGIFTKDIGTPNQFMRRQAVNFFCKAEGDFLNPNHFSPRNASIRDPYVVLKSQAEVEEAFLKSKIGRNLKITIAGIGSKNRRKEIMTLIQKLREDVSNERLPMILDII